MIALCPIKEVNLEVLFDYMHVEGSYLDTVIEILASFPCGLQDWSLVIIFFVFWLWSFTSKWQTYSEQQYSTLVLHVNCRDSKDLCVLLHSAASLLN